MECPYENCPLKCKSKTIHHKRYKCMGNVKPSTSKPSTNKPSIDKKSPNIDYQKLNELRQHQKQRQNLRDLLDRDALRSDIQDTYKFYLKEFSSNQKVKQEFRNKLRQEVDRYPVQFDYKVSRQRAQQIAKSLSH